MSKGSEPYHITNDLIMKYQMTLNHITKQLRIISSHENGSESYRNDSESHRMQAVLNHTSKWL